MIMILQSQQTMEWVNNLNYTNNSNYKSKTLVILASVFFCATHITRKKIKALDEVLSPKAFTVGVGKYNNESLKNAL